MTFSAASPLGDYGQRATVRQLADQAFSRASGAPPRAGNRVALIKDAAENYPAWLEALEGARRTIHFRDRTVRERT